MPSPPLSMQPVLTAEAMREADRFSIEEYGIPGFTLMETAARGAADRIEQAFGPLAGKTVACFGGKGNNGGDGFVVARVLHARGARVRVLAMSGPEAMSDDAAHNWRLLEQLAEQDSERLALARFEDLIRQRRGRHLADDLPETPDARARSRTVSGPGRDGLRLAVSLR